MKRVLLLAGVMALAGLCWQVAAAWAADSIVLAPPSSQPVAGQVTRVPIGVSVDSSFSGGSMEVKTKVSGMCAQSPSADTGTAAKFEGNLNALPFQGPWLRPPGVLVALVILRQGRNVICAWLLDRAGAVVASQSVATVALPATGTLLRSWHRQTAACRSLTRAEAGAALDEPAGTVFVKGGLWESGLTAFEQQHSALCSWQYTARSDRYFGVILSPEQSRPTLAHAVQLYLQTGNLEKTPGSCAKVSGIGSAACIFTGTRQMGTLVAVEPHLVLQLIFHLLFPHRPTDTAARIHAQEELLARKVLARVPLAHLP
jgi:hypothetical protein